MNLYQNKKTESQPDPHQKGERVNNAVEVRKMADEPVSSKSNFQSRFWKTKGFRHGVLVVLAVTVLNVSLYSIVTSHIYNIRSLSDAKPETTEIKSKPKARKKTPAKIAEVQVADEIVTPEITPVKESVLFKGDEIVSFMNGASPVEIVFVRDNVARMTVDGEIISREEFPDYAVLIEEARMIAKEKNGEEVLDPKENKNKMIMNLLIKELVDDHMISEGAHFDFLLSGVEVKLNDVVQKNEFFQKYHSLYKELSGIELKGRSNIRIKH